MNFFRKKKNLDELMNIPIEAEERSVPGIYDPNFVEDHRSEHQAATRAQSGSAWKFTVDPRSTVFSKSANPRDFPHKSTIRVLFRAKSVDPKTYSPPSNNASPSDISPITLGDRGCFFWLRSCDRDRAKSIFPPGQKQANPSSHFTPSVYPVPCIRHKRN